MAGCRRAAASPGLNAAALREFVALLAAPLPRLDYCGPAVVEPRVLATLAVMVSADNVVFYDLAPRQRSQWAGSDMNRDEQEPDCDPELDVYDHFWSANMVCSYPDRNGDWESVTTLSDFCWSRTCIVRT